MEEVPHCVVVEELNDRSAEGAGWEVLEMSFTARRVESQERSIVSRSGSFFICFDFITNFSKSNFV